MNLSDEVDLEDYVSRPDKISAAEIAAICQEAGMLAVRKNRCAGGAFLLAIMKSRDLRNEELRCRPEAHRCTCSSCRYVRKNGCEGIVQKRVLCSGAKEPCPTVSILAVRAGCDCKG